MAQFLRNPSAMKILSTSARAFSTNMLWTRYSVFRQILPNFPHPRSQSLSKNQMVKLRSPPIYSSAPRKSQLNEQVQPVVNKYVDFLRFDADADEDDSNNEERDDGDGDDDYDDDDDGDDGIKWTLAKRPGAPDWPPLDDLTWKQPEKSGTCSVSMQNPNQRPETTYFQKLYECDIRHKLCLENARKQRRILELMQIQRQLDEAEPIRFAPKKSLLDHTRSDLRDQEYHRPLYSDTSIFIHPMRYMRHKK